MTGEEQMQLLGHTDIVNDVDFSPDGHYLLTAGTDRTGRLWDVQTGTELRRFVGHTDSVISIKFSPDAHTILSSSNDKTVRLWDVQTGEELRRIIGHTGIVRTTFSPDGQNILTVGEDRSVQLWNITDVNESQAALNYGPGHAAFLADVAISANGHHVFTGQSDGIVQVWERMTGEEALQFDVGDTALTTIALAPSQRYVVVGNESGWVFIWDLEQDQIINQFQVTEGSVRQVDVAPDEKTFVTAGEDQVARIWDITSGKAIQELSSHDDDIYALAYSENGQYIVTGSVDQTAILWTITDGKQYRQFAGHKGAISSVAISPDGKKILTGSTDNTAVLWDVESGEQLFELVGHTDQISHVVFSPDGRYGLTGSADQTARLWDVANGQLLRQYSGHNSPLQQVVFSDDGQNVFTADSRSVYIWHIALEETITFACDQLSRDFTEEERAFYRIEGNDPTCPQADEQVPMVEPTWTPIALNSEVLQEKPFPLVTEIEFVNTEPGMISMGLPTQWVFVSANDDEIVRLENIDEEVLDTPIFASSIKIPTDLQEPFDLGPFPKGDPLGMTLREYTVAGGRGTYMLEGNRALLDFTFYNLIPNGVYTLWCVEYTIIPSPTVLKEVPCGAPDGSENTFIADEEGNGNIYLEMDALPISTNAIIQEIAVAYHSDGLTHGESVGEFGKNAHIQLLYDFPPQGQ